MKNKKEYPKKWWLAKTRADFNKMIRLIESDKNGFSKCVTCGVRKHYKEMNAGHYRHGLDFIRENQHNQCVKCNKYMSGNLAEYTLFMIDNYGRERVDEIMNMPKLKILTVDKLQQMRTEYRDKIKQIEDRMAGK